MRKRKSLSLGSHHGVREGMTVTFKPGSNPSGTGLVISVFRSSATVEVQELFGSAMIDRGMSIELDRRQWMADSR